MSCRSISLDTIRTSTRYDQFRTGHTNHACTGHLHNYVRMLWGKRVIEWTRSYGILWCFGKHDRPWFDREIFGTLRYMTSQSMAKKFPAKKYIRSVDERCSEFEL